MRSRRSPASFTLFQRTPQWIFPLPNRSYTRATRWLYRRFPALNRVAYRGWQLLFEATFGRAVIKPGLRRKAISAACRLHLRSVRDPDLRRRFTPDYEPMCKRLVLGTGFYKLFERANVELVDEGIHLVEPRGIVTRDGDAARARRDRAGDGVRRAGVRASDGADRPRRPAAVGGVGAGAARLPVGRAARGSRTC